MKTFIYVEHKDKTSQVTAYVYRIKNNKPCYIGVATWNRYACSGNNLEVLQFLVGEFELPKKALDMRINHNNLFNIYKVG